MPDDGHQPERIVTSGSAAQIREFRSRVSHILARYRGYDTDFSLQRWLNAYNADFDEASQKLQWALHVLDAVGALREYENAEELNSYLGTLNASAEHLPGGVMGTDRSGNILVVQPIGLSRPRMMVHLGRVSDLYRAQIIEAEGCMSLLRREEQRRMCKLSIIIIVDMNGFCLDTMYMPAIKVFINVLGVVQLLFPDSVEKVYVINAPKAFNLLYRMAKQVLSQKMIESISFLGNDWKLILKDKFGEENIFEYWGGTKPAKIPTGTIRMGGEVPEELSQRLKQSLKFLPSDQLNKTTISPGNCFTLPVYVDKVNSTLEWYFMVYSGDVDFWITYEQELVRFQLNFS